MAGTLLQAHLIASALVTLPLALMKSQRLLALEEVTRSHEELDAILAATTATAIIGIGLDGRVEYVNVGAEHLTGYRARELLGRMTVMLAERGDEEHAIAFSDERAGRGARACTPPSARCWTPRTTPTSRTGASGAPTAPCSPPRSRSAAGTPPRAPRPATSPWPRTSPSAAGRSATSQEALASEKLVVDRLAQLDQTKNDFLSTVSHELRTPITSILGYSQLLLGQDAADLPAIQRQVVGRIERNGRRLMGLIEDMLAMSQIEVGTFGFTRVPLDVREPLDAGLESTRPLLPARDLELEQHVAERRRCSSPATPTSWSGRSRTCSPTP